MAPAVPAVEIAHHGDAPGIGRPDGETHASDALDVHGLGTEAAAQFQVAAFGQQVDIELAEQQDVDVDCPRALPFIPLPAEFPLDLENVGHQSFGRANRIEADGAV